MFEDIKEADGDNEHSNADRRCSWITDERKGSDNIIKIETEETKSIDVDLDQIDIK